MMPNKDIETLFKCHYGVLHRLAAMILHDSEAANDAVHDVFASLLDVGELEGVQLSYLMSCVRNRCISQLRRNDTHERFKNLFPVSESDFDDESWPDETTFDKIHSEVNSLPSRCSEILKMRFYNGIDTAAIARKLEISERAVYKHLHHALELLRKNLKQNG